MASPSSSQANLRPDLSLAVFEYDLANQEGYIGNQVLPVHEVGDQAGPYAIIPIEQLLQTRDTKRGPTGGYSRSNFTFTNGSYATQEHGAEEVIDRRQARIYRNFFDHEMVHALRARDAVWRNYEIRCAAKVFDATTFASQLTNITNEWDDFANATPITDWMAAGERMWVLCGRYPNTLVLNRSVFRNLIRCAQVLDAIKYVEGTLPGDINARHIERAFDLPSGGVIVAGQPKNSANPGQTASLAHIWSSEYAAAIHRSASPDPSAPSFGRTLHWGEDGSSMGGVFESYYEEAVRGDVIRNRMDTEEKIIYPEMIQLLGNVTTI